MINKEEVDALSFIVPEASAYERGRKMCEKLKTEIPRQLFEVPIQAAVGSKVTAVTFHGRENFLKNRRKERNVCARLVMWKFHSQHLWQY